jgi:hypothetical protein
MFAAILRASSLLSNLAAERRPRRAPEAMSAIPKSWKPSRRDGSSSLYCLIGDFVSQEIAFVRLIKVFVAIVHPGSLLSARALSVTTKQASNSSTVQGGGKRRTDIIA